MGLSRTPQALMAHPTALMDPNMFLTWRIMGLSKYGYKYLNWGYK